MKIKGILLLFLLAAGNLLYGVNAPVTSAPSVTNAVNGHTIAAPITVAGFVDIGAFTLTLNYPSSSLTFQSASANPAFSGLTINSATAGRIIITWTGTNGITLPDQTQLVSITFNYISGAAALTWNTSGTACQYKKYDGGAFTVMSDSPKASYYIAGVVASHVAPVTYAPVITTATPGTIYLPITVKNYSGIGSFTLTLLYDVSTLTYLNSFTPNPIFTGNFVVGTDDWTSGKKIMTISWFGNTGSLADGSALVTLKFNYSAAFSTGNFSVLSWFDMGPSCEYADGSSVVLYDTPTGDYYKNGYVTKQVSPVTWLPSISDAVPGNTVQVPVLVNDFSNISTISLSFKYDPAVLTLPAGAYTPNPAFGSSMLVSNYAPGADGKRTLVIGWNGSPKTLANGSALITFSFQYASGATALKWCSSGDSCEYSDNLYNPLWKSPFEQYYQGGFVTSHPAPKTALGTGAGIPGQPVTVPFTVTGFSNIGSFTLTITYNPGVVSFLSATPGQPLGGTFTPGNPEPGLLSIAWSGSPASLPDGSTLANLSFAYISGSTPLQFYQNGTSCVYKEGNTLNILYDQPKSSYYTNGSVSPGKVCNLSVLFEGLYNGNGTLFKARDAEGEHFPGDTADLITVELHNASAYNDAPVYTATDVSLNTSGVAHAGIPTSCNGHYYLTVKYRTSIETTSANAVDFSGSVINYTFDAFSKAYDGYMTTVLEADGETVSPPLIYGGDVNQDGAVEAEDLNQVDNAAAEFMAGYVPQDVYADGQVEAMDVNIAGNNAAVFVYKHVPE